MWSVEEGMEAASATEDQELCLENDKKWATHKR
jgi:hypothetical protein